MAVLAQFLFALVGQLSPRQRLWGRGWDYSGRPSPLIVAEKERSMLQSGHATILDDWADSRAGRLRAPRAGQPGLESDRFIPDLEPAPGVWGERHPVLSPAPDPRPRLGCFDSHAGCTPRPAHRADG